MPVPVGERHVGWTGCVRSGLGREDREVCVVGPRVARECERVGKVGGGFRMLSDDETAQNLHADVPGICHNPAYFAKFAAYERATSLFIGLVLNRKVNCRGQSRH